jgi:hypothetical protein
VLTATLMLPSLAYGDSRGAAPADEAAPAADEAAPAADEADEAAPADVINPDLAAAAPQPDWVREGYGTGTGVAGPDMDPRVLNRKIRTAGKVTLAGGGIAILGGVIAITGAILLFGVRPSTKLNALKSDTGSLPVNNDKRHTYIAIARSGPIVAYAGLGVLVAGVITAAVGRSRLKKLREQRRTSSVAFMPPSFGPAQLGRGAQVQWEVRF